MSVCEVKDDLEERLARRRKRAEWRKREFVTSLWEALDLIYEKLEHIESRIAERERSDQ